MTDSLDDRILAALQKWKPCEDGTFRFNMVRNRMARRPHRIAPHETDAALKRMLNAGSIRNAGGGRLYLP